MDKTEKAVYLTFDDGPIPESTPFILETLAAYDAHATFFMVGDNVRKYPELFKQIVAAGHQVGNHTFNHWGGFKHTTKSYSANTEKANQLIGAHLFRPPHGWMRWEQYFWLGRKYRIVMWDLVTRDYSKWLTAEDVLRNVKRYTRNGSIITFHDGQMTADKFVRPDTLLIMALGLVAFIFDTAGGVLFAKLLNLFLPEGKKLNPMIGAAGISAFPMSGRVVNKMGLAEDNQNFLLMYSISVNVSGQIASVLAGGLILSLMA